MISTQEAYEHLRTELLNGRSEPAARLKVNELCRSLGVSLSAVRKALSQLTSEGLVVGIPRDLNREHQEIMEAALASDVKAAGKLLAQHLQLTTKSLLAQPQLAVPEAGSARPDGISSSSGKARQVLGSPAAENGDLKVPARSARRIPTARNREAGRGMPRLES